MSSYYQFLSGAVMMGCWIAGAFFFRFWSKTRDRLFFLFGFAFWIMTLERMVLGVLRDQGSEEHSYVYLIRLASFVVILFAIVDKNRSEKI